MDIPILYQDDLLVVINKPAGITVNRADTVGEETVRDWVEKRFGYRLSVISYQSQVSRFSVNQSITGKPKTDKPVTDLPAEERAMSRERIVREAGEWQAEAGNRKPKTDNGINSTFLSRSGIVHRLDKETSGCLIVAKTPESFGELQRQFKHREVKKEYLALVRGRVEPKQGTIRVPLARSRFDRQKFSVSVFGRPAETSYEVVQTFQGLSSKDSPPRRVLENQFTLLKLFPTTGRTHQIRVHLKYFGHPIVSDEKYGGKRAIEDRKWCPRLFLHAAKITFAHPNSGKSISIEAPLPADLNKSIRYFMPKVSDSLHF